MPDRVHTHLVDLLYQYNYEHRHSLNESVMPYGFHLFESCYTNHCWRISSAFASYDHSTSAAHILRHYFYILQYKQDDTVIQACFEVIKLQ